MSGECEKCGDHTMDCECNEIRSRKEEFEADLKHLLRTLELLFHRKADHVDYVKSYKYFKDTWSPS
jgi:hypothetical protein